MAAYTEQDGKTASSSDVDLLLHPELMSQEFLQHVLCGKNVSTRGCDSRDRLTELYLQHVIPLPQRRLPHSRWGRRMEKSRGRQSSAGHSSSNDHSRKRPLIVFDGTSSHSGPLKVKKPEGTAVSPGDRLKPPPAVNLYNPVRKISGNTSSSSSSSSSLCSTDTAHLKREANSTTIYDHSRKRPLIVFDGTSSHSGPLKVKKPEGTAVSPGDRLKPPPAVNLYNPVRKMSGNTSSSSSSSSSLCSTDTAHLKREANSTDGMHSPELKKKISHVTWP